MLYYLKNHIKQHCVEHIPAHNLTYAHSTQKAFINLENENGPTRIPLHVILSNAYVARCQNEFL